jgi:hypothetical protein
LTIETILLHLILNEYYRNMDGRTFQVPRDDEFSNLSKFLFFLLLEVSSFNGSAKIERKICTKE